MDLIENKTFLHFDTQDRLEIDREYATSAILNPFSSVFSNINLETLDTTTNGSFPTVKIAFASQRGHDFCTGKTVEHIQSVVKVLSDKYIDALKYLRESIFEEVRLQSFPDYPSRMTGIWVMDSGDQVAQYWWSYLGRPDVKLYELSLTGKIHRGPESLLSLDRYRDIASIRKAAEVYWRGDVSTNPCEIENIFEGKFEVLRIVDHLNFK